jgi:nucleoid DNA-binding protein
MNKNELIDIFAKEEDLTKKESKRMIDTVFKIISNNLINNNKVVITGFGTFTIHYSKERRGINPNTHLEIVIPANKSVIFRPSIILKKKINIHNQLRP